MKVFCTINVIMDMMIESIHAHENGVVTKRRERVLAEWK